MRNRGWKFRFIVLCAVGFLFGSIWCLWAGKGTTILNTACLLQMKNFRPDTVEYLYYVAKLRFGAVFFLSIAAATNLAVPLIGGAAVWFGACFGMYAFSALLRYGIKGFILLQAALLPEFLLYLPAFLALFIWCMELNRMIRQQKTHSKGEMAVRFARIFMTIGAGVLLEGLLGPAIFRGILRIL